MVGHGHCQYSATAQITPGKTGGGSVWGQGCVGISDDGIQAIRYFITLHLNLSPVQKLFFLLFFFALGATASAQTLPIDTATGKVCYSETVPLNNTPADTIFKRSKAWFIVNLNGHHSEQKKPIHAGRYIVNDRETGRVSVQMWQRTGGDNWMFYTLYLKVEDGVYTYIISNIELGGWQDHTSIEQLIIDNKKNDGTWKGSFKKQLLQIDLNIKSIIKTFRAKLA
jgi:hypothetical protein